MGDAENNAVFTLEEKGRIRYHLGYTSVQPATSIVLGIQGSTQTQFIIESTMNHMPQSQAPMVRRLVSILDGIEVRMIEAQERLAAKVVDEIELNPDECDNLEREYTRWAKRLSDLTASPLNPYSQRFNGGKTPLNISVRH